MKEHPECKQGEQFHINVVDSDIRIGNIAYNCDGKVLPGYLPLFIKTPVCTHHHISYNMAIKIAELACIETQLIIRNMIEKQLARPEATSQYRIETVAKYTEFLAQITDSGYHISDAAGGGIYIKSQNKSQFLARIRQSCVTLSTTPSAREYTHFRDIVKRMCTPDFPDIELKLTTKQEKELNRMICACT